MRVMTPHTPPLETPDAVFLRMGHRAGSIRPLSLVCVCVCVCVWSVLWQGCFKSRVQSTWTRYAVCERLVLEMCL